MLIKLGNYIYIDSGLLKSSDCTLTTFQETIKSYLLCYSEADTYETFMLTSYFELRFTPKKNDMLKKIKKMLVER